MSNKRQICLRWCTECSQRSSAMHLRVRLLDFLADHPDFDYTISRHPVTGHHDAEVKYMTIHYVVI